MTVEVKCSIVGPNTVRMFGRVRVEELGEDEINQHMAAWLSEGWELVSTSSVTRSVEDASGTFATDIYMFWRREVFSESE